VRFEEVLYLGARTKHGPIILVAVEQDQVVGGPIAQVAPARVSWSGAGPNRSLDGSRVNVRFEEVLYLGARTKHRLAVRRFADQNHIGAGLVAPVAPAALTRYFPNVHGGMSPWTGSP
jgi:hypothetical protein